MPAHAIAFSTPGAMELAWSAYAEPVRELWPGLDRPRLEWLPLDVLIAQLEGRPADAPPLPAAALIVLGGSEPATLIDRLTEAMLARNVPGVVLHPDPADWKRFQRFGVLFEAHGSDPRSLASMLFALAERQSAVDALARELHVANRTQAGFRVEMDRLNDELHMAASVQREFLPAGPPAMPGLEVGVIFRPVNFVSGDIYSVERLDDSRMGLFIADAVGHGVPAALLTMVLCHNLRTTEPGALGRSIIEPAVVLERLNARLCEARATGGRFATAAYAIADVERGCVTVAGAGHPPPLIIGDGAATPIETDGPLLGVFPDAAFSQAEADLRPGQSLLMYTDGLEWAFPDLVGPDKQRRTSKRYLEHLTRLAADAREATVADVMGRLGQLLDEQSGSLHQVDDVTALAVAPRERAKDMRAAA